MKKSILTFILVFGVWSAVLFSGVLSFLDWINLSFIVGICSLLAAAVFTIIKSGFLTLFFKGFRIIGGMIIPQSNAMKRTNNLIDRDVKWQEFKQKISGILANISLLVGLSTLTVSMIGLLFYY